jgi:hypothetical protein
MSLSSLGIKSVQQQLVPNMMNNRGVWNNTTYYYQNDAVLSPNNRYAVAMTPNVNNNPDTASPNPWLVATGGGGGNQTLTFDASNVLLSISGGNTISIDAPQLLDISGSALSITRGNTITLPTSLVQDLSFNSVSFDLAITGGNNVSLNPLIQDLSFNTLTNTLSITNGNSVVLNAGGGSASNWATYPAVQNVDMSGSSVLNALTYQINNPGASNSFDYINSNATTAMNTSALYIERDRLASQGNPVGANFIVESHWYKEDPSPSLNQDFTFRIWQDGNQAYLRQAWELSGNNPPPTYTGGGIELQGVPVSVATNQGGGAGFVLKSTANGWNNLYTDSNGDLYAQASSNAGVSWGTAVPLTTPFTTLKTQVVNQALQVVSPLSNVLMPSNYSYIHYAETFSNWSSTPTNGYLSLTLNGALAGSNGSGAPHDFGYVVFQWSLNGNPLSNMDNYGSGFPCLPIGNNNNIGAWSITASQTITGLTSSDSVGVEVLITTASPLLFSNAEYTSSLATPFFGTLTPI